jgi:hypothetical protein
VARARLITGLVLAGCAACTGPRGAVAPAPATPPGVASPQRARLLALQAALQEHEDELAEHLIGLLRGTPLTASEARFLEGAELVLEGRRVVAGLQLALESRPTEGVSEEAARFTLWLTIGSRLAQDVELELPPADLRRARHAIDARGAEGMEVESRAVHALDALLVPAGGTREVPLMDYDLPCGRALAVREHWSLATRSGQVRVGDRHLPAAEVVVTDCQRERLSPLFPAEPVAPGAPAERLASSEPLTTRAFLELALRVAPVERAAALESLEPVVQRLAGEDPDRLRRAEPALRWLTGRRDVTTGPETWSRYLREGRWDQPVERPRQDDDLDLPGDRRGL